MTEEVTDLRALISDRQSKTVNFMTKKLRINKLTLTECTDVQKQAQTIDAEDPSKAFDLLKHIVRIGVPMAADFTDDDFGHFPMDDLNKLSDEVLKYAGMDPNRK